MSAKAIIEGLKQGSDAELEFVKQLRKGLCTILNGMEVECYRRGDALGELEEDLQEDGHLRPSEEELRAEIHTLTNEREKLCQENKMWRLKVAELKSSQVKAALSAAPQNGAPTGLSNRRKKVLTRIINTAVVNSNEAHLLIKSQARDREEEADTDEVSIFNLGQAEQDSLALKQSLNNLVDMVNMTGYSVASQDLKNAMRRWGDIHRCLATERTSVTQRWDRQNNRTWEVFKQDREIVRSQIASSRQLAVELELDLSRIDEDASF